MDTTQHVISSTYSRLVQPGDRERYVLIAGGTLNGFVEGSYLCYTERINPVNLQYEHLLNSHEDFRCNLHDTTCILFSITAKHIESKIQDIETKDNSVNVAA